MNGSSGTPAREAAQTNEVSVLETSRAAIFQPVIRPENRLNAVVVRDVTSRMPMYDKLISQLDVPQKLVEIEVTVVELSKKDALDWQLSLKATGAHREFSGAAGQNAANLFQASELAGRGMAGAVSYLGDNVQVAASLTALKEKGQARNISRTSLVTVNNMAAQMEDSQSYHVRVVGTEVATLEEVMAGTVLQVKPRIVNSRAEGVANQIWLSMRLDDGGFESIAVDSMPMTRTSSLQTQTAVFENESIMLAGYLRDIEESGGWGIPYLRDIPLIGWLFGGSSIKKETVQRMFILSPHIVDLDAEMLARLQATRLRDVSNEETIADDAEESDDERREREQERENAKRIRHEQHEDRYERRQAEIEHGNEMREIERERKRKRLEADVKNWKEEEKAAKEQLEKDE